MRTAILLFPGINRERDMAIAVRQSFGAEPKMVWHKETDLSGFDLVIIPGGFSFGDYLRCGAMAAQSPIMRAVKDHAARGGYVLGVCNGFQILTEAGLLPGALLRNAGLALPLDGHDAEGRAQRHRLHREIRRRRNFPRAHGPWRRQLHRRHETLDRLEGENLVAFRYADGNRNGAARDIAGIYSPNLRILGLMPHPEDLVDPLLGGTDGKPLFDSLAAA